MAGCQLAQVVWREWTTKREQLTMVMFVASQTVLEMEASTVRTVLSAEVDGLGTERRKQLLTMYNGEVRNVHVTGLERSFAVVLISFCPRQGAD